MGTENITLHRIMQEGVDGIDERCRVTGGNDLAATGNEVGDVSQPSGDHRDTGCQVLDNLDWRKVEELLWRVRRQTDPSSTNGCDCIRLAEWPGDLDVIDHTVHPSSFEHGFDARPAADHEQASIVPALAEFGENAWQSASTVPGFWMAQESDCRSFITLDIADEQGWIEAVVFHRHGTITTNRCDMVPKRRRDGDDEIRLPKEPQFRIQIAGRHRARTMPVRLGDQRGVDLEDERAPCPPSEFQTLHMTEAVPLVDDIRCSVAFDDRSQRDTLVERVDHEAEVDVRPSADDDDDLVLISER